MHPVEKHLKETAFAGVEGTRIEGTIALSDELINLGIVEALAKLKAAGADTTQPVTTEAAGTKSAGESVDFDPKAMLQKLDIERLQYRTEQGKTMVDFKAGFG